MLIFILLHSFAIVPTLTATAACPRVNDVSFALQEMYAMDAKAQFDRSGGVATATSDMLHLTNTTKKEFKQIFSTTMAPIVVDDTIRDGDPMKQWTSCQKIATLFSDVRMRREYMDDIEIDKYTGEPVNHQRLGDAYSGTETDWTIQAISNGDDRLHSLSSTTSSAPKYAPKYAPNYLPWKEMTMPDRKTGIVWLDEFQKYIAIPYYLRNNRWSNHHIYRSPEMWFAPVGGSGAKAHADSHCEATISIQLSGKKKWNISPMHSFKSWNGPVARSFDGQIDLSKWIPSHQVELTPGQAVVFPPGMIHQTMSIQDENANDGDGDETTCAASITYQWFGPIASTYIKSHMGRLLLSGALNECFSQWHYLIMMSPPSLYEDVLNQYRLTGFLVRGEDDDEDNDEDEDEDEDEDDVEQGRKQQKDRDKASDGCAFGNWNSTTLKLTQVANTIVDSVFDSVFDSVNAVAGGGSARANPNALSLQNIGVYLKTWQQRKGQRREEEEDRVLSMAEDMLDYQDTNRNNYVERNELFTSILYFLRLSHIRKILWAPKKIIMKACSKEILHALGLENGGMANDQEFWLDLWTNSRHQSNVEQILQQQEHTPVRVEDDVNQKCMAGLEQILILIQTRKDLHKKEERDGGTGTNQTVPRKQ